MLTFNEIIDTFSRINPLKIAVRDENRELSYKNLESREKPFYRVTCKNGIIKKYIDVLIDPNDFDKKKYRVKATADNAKTIYEK